MRLLTGTPAESIDHERTRVAGLVVRGAHHAAAYRVDYLPAESDSGMFGGNSNWRGPIWMPVNALIIRALLQYYSYYGNSFTIECPTGSGHHMNLYQVAEEISRRLSNIFLRDSSGHRPVYGGSQKFQNDSHWRDHVLFYEYFHGDNGAGLGASHQTGWTGLVARMMHLFATLTPEQVIAGGKQAYSQTEAARKPASLLEFAKAIALCIQNCSMSFLSGAYSPPSPDCCC